MYKNLYWDSVDQAFIFYRPESDANATKTCVVELRGKFPFRPTTRAELPSFDRAAELGVHNGTVELEQRHHLNFAHAFLEHTMVWYWTGAEYFGDWNFDAEVRVFRL